MTSIVIPESIKSIGDVTFYNSDIEKIYYEGTLENWNTIEIGYDPVIANSTLYLYSETEPTEEGNYWRYDVDGITVIEW